MILSPSVTSAAVRSTGAVLLLVHCLLLLPLFVGDLCLALVLYAAFSVVSSFAMISSRKRELGALFNLSFCCWFSVTLPCDAVG